jgi:hypothetical protein
MSADRGSGSGVRGAVGQHRQHDLLVLRRGLETILQRRPLEMPLSSSGSARSRFIARSRVASQSAANWSSRRRQSSNVLRDTSAAVAASCLLPREASASSACVYYLRSSCRPTTASCSYAECTTTERPPQFSAEFSAFRAAAAFLYGSSHPFGIVARLSVLRWRRCSGAAAERCAK